MIKMIAGVYGLLVENADGSTRVKRMGPENGPFSVAPEKEARLVKLGLARYVGGKSNDAANEPNVGMTAKELREIGKARGLTFRVGITKAEMVAAINGEQPEPDPSVEEPAPVEEPEPEEVPAEEEAPTFDAAEAVQ